MKKVFSRVLALMLGLHPVLCAASPRGAQRFSRGEARFTPPGAGRQALRVMDLAVSEAINPGNIIQEMLRRPHQVTPELWELLVRDPEGAIMPDLDDETNPALPFSEAILTPRANSNLTLLLNLDQGQKAEPLPFLSEARAEQDSWGALAVANKVLSRFDPEVLRLDASRENSSGQLAAATAELFDGLQQAGFLDPDLAVPSVAPHARRPSPRRNRKLRSVRNLWKKVDQAARERGIETVSVQIGDFFHIDTNKKIEGSRIPRIPATAIEKAARGRHVLSVELPPRAVKAYWNSGRTGESSVVVEKNSFWRKVLGTSPRASRPSSFGVDADSALRYATHRMWWHFMGRGMGEDDLGAEWVENGEVDLKGLGGKGTLPSSEVLDRLPEPKRTEFEKGGIVWLEGDENPFSSKRAVLFKKPHDSFSRFFERLSGKYASLFVALGQRSSARNEAFTMYLTLAFAALRDYKQASLMADMTHRFLRTATDEDLPEPGKPFRIFHVGGAAHHVSLTQRLQETGLFSGETALRLESPFIDPRLNGMDLLGSDYLAEIAPDLLDHVRYRDGDVEIDDEVFAGHFGVYAHQDGKTVHGRGAFDTTRRLIEEGALEAASQNLDIIGKYSSDFREGGTYAYFKWLLSEGHPRLKGASEASRRNYILGQMALSDGNRRPFIRHQLVFWLRNFFNKRGWMVFPEIWVSFFVKDIDWEKSREISERQKSELVWKRVSQARFHLGLSEYHQAHLKLAEALKLDPNNETVLHTIKEVAVERAKQKERLAEPPPEDEKATPDSADP